MRTSELRELGREDLLSRLRQSEKELFDLRIQAVQGRMANSAKLKQVKRSIARIKTVLQQG